MINPYLFLSKSFKFESSEDLSARSFYTFMRRLSRDFFSDRAMVRDYISISLLFSCSLIWSIGWLSWLKKILSTADKSTQRKNCLLLKLISWRGWLSKVWLHKCLPKICLSEECTESRNDLSLILSLKDTFSSDSVIRCRPPGTKRAIIG